MPQSYGPALSLSDEELEEASEVKREDLILALAWLRLYAPELAFMVEASPFDREETAPLAYMAGLLSGGTRYLYLTQRGLFYDMRRRQAVDPAHVRSLLDKALDKAAQGARNQVLQLRAGQLDLPTWEVGMRDAVKRSTVSAHLTATGGIERTHLGALERMQATVYEQAKYLRRFAEQIESGEQPLDGRAQSRAAAYVQSARASHMEARREVAQALGFDQRRSIRYPGDSCKGCIQMEQRGWVPIDDETYIPIGKRECLSNCRCDEAYRNSASGETTASAAA